ncbi:MAG TPA: hypothetical protein VHA33_20860 [Candidatus Angelobacter sp.]|nr:hypothetical protein [Candidatus Angelobacter sp.]
MTDFTFHEIRAKYSCYLPDLSVHVCGALLQQETESSGYEYFVYYDYLYLLLRLKPLMMQNMATVVPRRYAIYDWRFDYGNTRKSIHEVYDRQQVIDIDILKPPNVPHVFQGKKEISELLPGAFALPYLEKIDLERYVDIVQKNRDLFAKISNEFRNSLEKEGGDFITAWVHAYNDALVDIQIAYEKAVKELNRNGISATVGLAITAFSLWMPGLSEAARAALAAIGSSKTIADGLGWIGDLRRLPESLRDKAGWLLWKSQRK